MIERLKDLAPNRLNRLAALHAAAFDGTGRGWSADEIADLSKRGALVADDADRGFALISAAADEAELLTIAVVPEARRAGLGALLLAVAEAAARDAGAARMFLEVAEDNAAAGALYRKTGYEEVGRRRRYYSRATGAVDAIMMAKALD